MASLCFSARPSTHYFMTNGERQPQTVYSPHERFSGYYYGCGAHTEQLVGTVSKIDHLINVFMILAIIGTLVAKQQGITNLASIEKTIAWCVITKTLLGFFKLYGATEQLVTYKFLYEEKKEDANGRDYALKMIVKKDGAAIAGTLLLTIGYLTSSILACQTLQFIQLGKHASWISSTSTATFASVLFLALGKAGSDCYNSKKRFDSEIARPCISSTADLLASPFELGLLSAAASPELRIACAAAAAFASLYSACKDCCDPAEK